MTLKNEAKIINTHSQILQQINLVYISYFKGIYCHFFLNVLITTQYVPRKSKVDQIIQFPDCSGSTGASSRKTDSHTDFFPSGCEVEDLVSSPY